MVFKEAAFLIELPHALISLAAWYFECIPPAKFCSKLDV